MDHAWSACLLGLRLRILYEEELEEVKAMCMEGVRTYRGHLDDTVLLHSEGEVGDSEN